MMIRSEFSMLNGEAACKPVDSFYRNRGGKHGAAVLRVVRQLQMADVCPLEPLLDFFAGCLRPRRVDLKRKPVSDVFVAAPVAAGRWV